MNAARQPWLAPFYEGSTSAAIVRDEVMQLDPSPDQLVVLRSRARHIVAGVASEEEARACRAFCATLA